MRNLDWELLAVKLRLLDVHNELELSQWTLDPFDSNGDHPIPWILAYQEIQERLGIWPLTDEEGMLVKDAVVRLIHGDRADERRRGGASSVQTADAEPT